MSYTKKTWSTGEVITAADLNNMEQGIGDVDDRLSSIDSELEDTFARVDGYYDELTAGNAEQLVSTVGVEDKTPYLFRTTGGSTDVGDRVKLSEITGGTVAWNQLVENGNFESVDGWGGVDGTTYSVADNVITATSSTGADWFGFRQVNGATAVAQHKYLLYIEAKASVESLSVFAPYYYVDAIETPLTYKDIGLNWTVLEKIVNGKDDKEFRLGVRKGTGIYGSEVSIYGRNAYIVDLTAMFGSIIADYLYALESGTPGAGVAKLKSWGFCTKPYYAYDAGSLLSVKTSAHKEVGFNLLKQSLGYASTTSPTFNADNAARVISGHVYEYCFKGITGATSWRSAICCFDLNGVKIAGQRYKLDIPSGIVAYNPSGDYFVSGSNGTYKSVKFTPAFDGYIIPYYLLGDTSASTPIVDPCVHLVWDGERDGEYAPFEEYSYPLDSSLELRGIPKLDANNDLYYDGDGYAPDGTVTRRYGEYTITGNESFSETGSGQHIIAISTYGLYRLLKLSPSNSIIANVKCDFAVTKSYDSLNVSGDTTGIGVGETFFIVGSKEYSEWDTLAGKKIIIELATPTAETADPYQEMQICDDFGTEEFVDSRELPMPVGSVSFYQNDLRAKLEMAPVSPTGNGDYILRQTDGRNEYVPLVKDIPSVPSDNGIYVLKVVVLNGVATKTWVEET